MFKPPFFYTVDELIEYAQSCGSHWFNEETMEYFGTTIEDDMVYHNRYFITREESRSQFTTNVYMVRMYTFDYDLAIDIRPLTYTGFASHADAVAYIEDVTANPRPKMVTAPIPESEYNP